MVIMKKIFTIIFVALIAIFGIWFWWKFYYTYSDGNRTGLLQKFSHKGNVFKTYEGELVMSSIIANGASPIASEKFYFSVADPTLGEKMKNYEGKKVVLVYKQKNGTLPWRGDSQYIVDSVRVVDP